MKRFVFGLVVVAFVTAVAPPTFACGPNSRKCMLHHEQCKCPPGQQPRR